MKAAISNNAGHRHGHRGYHGCPPFAFSYADGVAIDRGQEERLSVKDIAIQSSAPPCTVTDDPEREVGIESGRVLKEMHVFLRAGEPRTKQATTDDGAGVLHRWESLQRGSCGGEVREQAREASFRKTGGAEVLSASRCISRERLSKWTVRAIVFDKSKRFRLKKQNCQPRFNNSFWDNSTTLNHFLSNIVDPAFVLTYPIDLIPFFRYSCRLPPRAAQILLLPSILVSVIFGLDVMLFTLHFFPPDHFRLQIGSALLHGELLPKLLFVTPLLSRIFVATLVVDDGGRWKPKRGNRLRFLRSWRRGTIWRRYRQCECIAVDAGRSTSASTPTAPIQKIFRQL